jgi:hypothetical protein
MMYNEHKYIYIVFFATRMRRFNMKRRLTSLLLSVVILIGALPLQTFADEFEEEVPLLNSELDFAEAPDIIGEPPPQTFADEFEEEVPLLNSELDFAEAPNIVGGVLPVEATALPIDLTPPPQGTNSPIQKFRINSYATGYVSSAAPGGINWGYNNLSDSSLTSDDVDKVKRIYEQLMTYANTLYNLQADYTSYNAPGVDLTSLAIPVAITISGNQASFDNNSPITIHSIKLLQLAWSVFTNDNPQFYMFDNGFAYGAGSVSGGSYVLTTFLPNISGEYNSYAVRQALQTKMEAKYQEYATLAGTVSSEYDKIRLVHDKIVAERDYSMYNGIPDDRAFAHNIVGVLDTSTPGPVCESYAEAFAYILHRLGVGNAIVVIGHAGDGGSGGGGGHAWNMVQVNGSWYYVDTTWDDQDTTVSDPGNKKNSVRYTYFLRGTSYAAFANMHTPGEVGGKNTPSSTWFLYNLPPTVASSDATPDAVFITDNGFFGNRYTYNLYQSSYNSSYVINYSNTSLDGITAAVTHNFGSYVVEDGQDVAIPNGVVGLTKRTYAFNTADSFSNPSLIDESFFRVEVEKPYKNGENRAYVYGISGDLRGIDFGIVTLSGVAGSPSGGDNTGGTGGGGTGGVSVPASAVIVPSDNAAAFINLTDETITLPSGYSVAAFSLNGGAKWTAVGTAKNPFNDVATLQKTLNKRADIWITAEYTKKTSKEPEKIGTSSLIKFKTITDRPKTNTEKLVPNYIAAGEGLWTLTAKNATTKQDLSKYLIAATDSKAKTATGAWTVFPTSGYEVRPEAKAKQKEFYIVKTAPTANADGSYTPASAVFKIMPAATGKAPTLKPDVKKEIIKVAKGYTYQIGGNTAVKVTGNAEEVSIAAAITAKQKLFVWKSATAIAAKTEVLTIDLGTIPRAEITTAALTATKGKLNTAELKTYEFLNPATNKWVTSLPRVTGTTTIQIRVKPTAAFKSGSWSGNTASLTGTMTVTWGVIDATAKTPKEGILSAAIAPETATT